MGQVLCMDTGLALVFCYCIPCSVLLWRFLTSRRTLKSNLVWGNMFECYGQAFWGATIGTLSLGQCWLLQVAVCSSHGLRLDSLQPVMTWSIEEVLDLCRNTLINIVCIIHKRYKITRGLKNDQRQHPVSTKSVMRQHQFCHCCKLGFVCLLTTVWRSSRGCCE